MFSNYNKSDFLPKVQERQFITSNNHHLTIQGVNEIKICNLGTSLETPWPLYIKWDDIYIIYIIYIYIYVLYNVYICCHFTDTTSSTLTRLFAKTVRYISLSLQLLLCWKYNLTFTAGFCLPPKPAVNRGFTVFVYFFIATNHLINMPNVKL